MPATSSLVQFANSSPVSLRSYFEGQSGLKKNTLPTSQLYIISFTSGSEAWTYGFSTVLKKARLSNNK